MAFSDYSELVRDCRAVLKNVEPDIYYKVTQRLAGCKSVIFDLSIYDEEVDGDKHAFMVSSREFKDNTAFYLNLARNLLSRLIVTVHDKPKWLFEAAPGALKGICRKTGETPDGLARIVRGGRLPEVLGGDPQRLKFLARARNKRLTRQSEQERAVAEEAEARAEEAERQKQASLGVVSHAKDEILVAKNMLEAEQARVKQLEAFIRENLLVVPPRRSVI